MSVEDRGINDNYNKKDFDQKHFSKQNNDNSNLSNLTNLIKLSQMNSSNF